MRSAYLQSSYSLSTSCMVYLGLVLVSVESKSVHGIYLLRLLLELLAATSIRLGPDAHAAR